MRGSIYCFVWQMKSWLILLYFIGTGSIVEFVTYAAGRKPDVIGKPEKMSRDIIEAAHGALDAEKTLMVGDR